MSLMNKVTRSGNAAWTGFGPLFDRIAQTRNHVAQRIQKLANAGYDWQRRSMEAGETISTELPAEVNDSVAKENARCAAELGAIGRDVAPAMSGEHRRLIEDAAAALSTAADTMDRLAAFEQRQASFLAQCGLPQAARTADAEITSFRATGWAINARRATTLPEARAARPAPARLDLSAAIS